MRTYPALILLTALLAAPATAEADEPEPTAAPAEEPVAKGPPPAPAPYFHVSPTLGAQAFPLGVTLYGSPQLRMSLYRSDSKLFRTTHFGIGPWLRVTPAFGEIGARMDFTPVEIFTFGVTARYVGSWTGSAGSRIPAAGLANKRYSVRKEGQDAASPTHAFEVLLSPTLRLKGGPVVVLYNFTWTFTQLFFPGGETPDSVYDGGLDLYIAPTDRTISQQGVVMVEALDGIKAKPVLRLGATVRHRRAMVSGDRSVNVGFIGTIKPVPHIAVPTVILQILPYVLDETGGRVLGPPNIVLALRWTFEKGPGVLGVPGLE